MSAAESDFEIAKAVEEKLKAIDKERQQRVLRWVAESLGLELKAADGSGSFKAGVGSDTLGGGQGQQARGPVTNIKTFVEEKRPKSDVQFVTVAAYFYAFEAPLESRKATIGAEDVKQAARGVYKQPKNALAALNNAKRQGYLDSSGPGQFRISSVGENLVAMTLPGTAGQRAAQSPRKKKPKAKAGKRRR